MVNYKSFRTLWIMSVAFCLTSIAFNWSDIPKQGIESFPLITFPGVIIFALTFLIIGMVMGLGKPKEKMPPTNKKFKVGYVKMILVAYKVPDGRILIGAGPVMSYYEFKHPMDDRLTDEKWRELLKSNPPDEPEWSK